jgi:hypothetical protein
MTVRVASPAGTRVTPPRGRLLARVAKVCGALAMASVMGCSLAVGAARLYQDSRAEASEHRERRLRRMIAAGAFDSALARVSSGEEWAPRDRLLRSLYYGIVAYYAGEYQRSGKALRTADELAEDRYTKSVSRGVLSMVSSDLVLPYMPGHTERLLVHYYAALGYLERGDVPGATVEARRLSQLLEQFDEQRDPADRSTRAFLRYFAGTVFEAAGDRNDADVAYRNAHELAPSEALPGNPKVPNLSGEIVVILERGFVPQRVEERMYIEIGDSERDDFVKASKKKKKKKESLDSGEVATHESAVSRLLSQIESSPDSGLYLTGDRRLRRDHDHFDDAVQHMLKVAWPVFLRPVHETAPITMILSHRDTTAFTLVANVSDAILADYRRSRPMLLARTVARAAVKYAATEVAEKEKGETGKAVASIAASVLEQADTRAWHLLPSDIALTRLTLPAGRHHLTMRLGTASDSGRVVDFGEVDVTPGGVAFAVTRVWPGGKEAENGVASRQ